MAAEETTDTSVVEESIGDTKTSSPHSDEVNTASENTQDKNPRRIPSGISSKKRSGSSISADKDGEKVPAGVKVSSMVEKAQKVSATQTDNVFQKLTQPFIDVFTEQGYSEPPIPDSDRIYYLTDDEDEIIVVGEDNEPVIRYVIPLMIDNWHAEYFYQPWQKARLARHSAYAAGMFFISVAMTLTPFTDLWSGIAAALISLVLFINFSFRHSGLAVSGVPMPRLPYLSDWGVSMHARQQEEYDEYIEHLESADGVQTVDPVDNVVDGNPSPATVLTRWMNSDAIQWTREDLVENSGGRIDTLRSKLLLRDSPDVWEDDDVIDVLARITNSNPDQWKDAWTMWSDAVLKQSSEEES